MVDLRKKLIEAGAQAYEQECHGMADDETWQAFKRNYPADYADMLREMGAALDAFLDCLAENRDEWAVRVGRVSNVDQQAAAAERLLAVLRESDDE